MKKLIFCLLLVTVIIPMMSEAAWICPSGRNACLDICDNEEDNCVAQCNRTYCRSCWDPIVNKPALCCDGVSTCSNGCYIERTNCDDRCNLQFQCYPVT